MRVSLFVRNPLDGHHSFERLYRRLAGALPSDVQPTIACSTFRSRGMLRRAYIAIEAAFRQGDVNHVTGDTHFLTYFLRRDRTILTIHDALSIGRLRGLRAWLFMLLWYRIPMSRARVITVVSHATKRRLSELGLAQGRDIRVIHNFAFGEFGPSPRPFNHVRPRILAVGTAPHKNLDRIAEALEGLSCELRIIGRTSDSLRRSLRRHQVPFSETHGLSDADVVAEYQSCDLLLFASLEEGFGLPILEAQATGRPVVTSNCSSMSEVAGDGAELVDPLDVSSIRSGVERIISDPERRLHLVERGFRNIRRFSATSIAEQYAALYREVAVPHSGASG